MAIPRLLLLLGTRSQWERDVATGFARRVRGRAEIDLGLLNRDAPRRRPAGVDGVLTAAAEARALTSPLHWGLPLVNAGLVSARVACVTVDDDAVGRLAAAHLLGLGWRRMALVGLPLRFWRIRAAALRAAVASAGGECYEAPPEARADWQGGEIGALVRWLAALPRPLAIVAANDTSALACLRACRAAGLVVGIDAAVVGADDEAALRGLLDPPVTTIDVAGETVGATAGDLLLRLTAGEAPPAHPVLIPPRGVVARASSAGPALDDPALTRAVRLALEHPDRPLSAADLVRATRLPRRTAELRFRRLLGRAPGAWLQERRLEQASHLLRSSDLPVAEVGRRCGWPDPAYFSRVFARARGISPSAWRRG